MKSCSMSLIWSRPLSPFRDTAETVDGRGGISDPLTERNEEE